MSQEGGRGPGLGGRDLSQGGMILAVGQHSRGMGRGWTEG